MKRLSLFFAALFAAVSLFAGNFTKVTAAPADWSGEYALVYEGTDANYVFNGVDANISAATPGAAQVTITDGTISNYTGVTIVVAALEDGGYSVAVNGGDNSGKFIASGSSAPTYSNALKFIAAAQRVDFAYADGAVVMSQIADKDVTSVDSVVTMRFNASSSEMRFRFYKSGQQPVQLYKLEAGNVDPVDPEPTTGIVYELNGGCASSYLTPQDLYADLNADWNAVTGQTSTWKALNLLAGTDGATGIPTSVTGGVMGENLDFFTNEAKGATKWGWLGEYLIAKSLENGKADPFVSGATYVRYALGDFFANYTHTNYLASGDFAVYGVNAVEAYMPTWGCGYGNPSNPTETFVLNAPYKANNTFDGWYTSADFSGEKVTSVDATTTGTLYAKWIEYIPTIAEVKAMADDTNTKVSGVVTFINGKNAYVQDATGGMLLYMKNNPTFTVGQKVIVSGTKTMYGGAPEVKNGEEVSAEAAALPDAVYFETIAAACKEGNIFKRVSFMGLKITSLDSYGNPYVTDGIDTLQCYKMVPDANVFTVGKKINITAILSYYNKYQLVGDVAGMEVVVVGAHDNYNYPARGANGEYTLENKWVISTVEDNYAANKPGSNDFVRGMAAKDGIMYFINRETKSLVRVDGNDGTMLDPIKITGEHLFEAEGHNEDGTGNGEWASCVTLPFNDIKFDGAGHALIGACLSGNQHFMVYKVDLTTGAATLVVDEAMNANPDFLNGEDKWSGRFDAFGVYGDVDNNAIIMAQDANSFNAYKWEITNGVAAEGEQISCIVDPETDASYLITDGALNVNNFGTAPQIFPVDENYFYVDGWSTLPMLFDMDGTLAEDFISCPTGVAVANNAGDTCKMNVGHNGICEFQVGDEYFMVMAATNTVGSPTSAFALYKFADAAKSFSGIEPLWYFPANGMGSLTNGCRTAVPSVEVNGTKATIYLYANNNGYAVYEFTGKEAAEPVSVEDMWIIGNCATAEWLPGASKKMTKTADGVFEVTETLTGTWFAFVTSIDNCTATTTDWDVINAHRFGSNPSGENISDGAAHAITGVNGDYSFTVSAAGTYKFVVDVNAMTVTCTPVSALENTEAATINKVVENGQVYIIKNGVRYSVLGAVVK